MASIFVIRAFVAHPRIEEFDESRTAQYRGGVLIDDGACWFPANEVFPSRRTAQAALLDRLRDSVQRCEANLTEAQARLAHAENDAVVESGDGETRRTNPS